MNILDRFLFGFIFTWILMALVLAIMGVNVLEGPLEANLVAPMIAGIAMIFVWKD